MSAFGMTFTPKMEVRILSDSLVLIYQTTRRYISEYCHIKFRSQYGKIYFLEIAPLSQCKCERAVTCNEQ
jgi:hypothetical protein